MNFLYDNIKKEFGRELRKVKDYPYIINNINSKLELRNYQKEAFNRFFLYYENDDIKEYVKPSSNIHLCFNMATGSGKTVIMSGLILYLYEQGYRDFLFFVNRRQIIEKTKDNFINSNSNKYLFSEKIVFNQKQIKLKAVDNFSESSLDAINICFTTIQGLFTDIHNEKENALTVEDFKDKKIVLIADEAHHINASTKKKIIQNDLFNEVEETPSWENTVEKIFKINTKNILLEFTATLELENKKVKEKYLDKIIYKYDLKDFVQDKYSKKIELLRSDTSKQTRILQAICTSIYREEIANKYSLNIKPVVLLKSSKIAESKENQEEFHSMIENLSKNEILKIKNNTNIEILKTAFEFFNNHNISLDILSEKIKIAFAPNKCLCTNSDNELEENQKLLNTLEDKNNSIRAIFTVDKLNEGWDVLNLFDIVRLYDGQSAGGNNKGKVGKKTISEAQLIGRGARYCPFKLDDTQEYYKRKYDDDIKNELRILEELYFHSENESRYISEIKKALIDIGLIESEENEPIEFKIKLKKEFNNVEFLNKKVFKNERRKKNYSYVKKLSDLGIAKSNFVYYIKSGKGSLLDVFEDEIQNEELNTNKKEKNLVEFCSENIIANAILYNDYFTMENLLTPLPNLKSIKDFIISDEYLKQFNIYLSGSEKDIVKLQTKDKLDIALAFLNVLENEMKNNIIKYEGTTKFKPYKFADIFKNKTLLIQKEKEKKIYSNRDNWFIFEEFYGTSEEEKLIELIGSMLSDIEAKYKKNKIYLVRNERHLDLYSFQDGQRFEPDFILFIQNASDNIHYQIFIEPKGEYLKKMDKWKEDFLRQLKHKVEGGIIEFENEQYKLLGLKFYSFNSENEFKNEFKSELNI
ncbi:DEAD/DEAH box helicase family protein [Arcobacter sp. CECT 9188]|uniref:DEAD/DEAH box helicase family protein n=1 Tax=Arcobacter sp. CECT 9188 TaxID=2044505 RepID=UPI002159E246|nr:DEAD/DEAH box helicase family protein [Arcobacter sp. CECT 9188]